jgi:hypothetical protein
MKVLVFKAENGEALGEFEASPKKGTNHTVESAAVELVNKLKPKLVCVIIDQYGIIARSSGFPAGHAWAPRPTDVMVSV